MSRSNVSTAHARAAGNCRKRRRQRAARRPEWVRPLRRAQRKLDSAAARIQGLMALVVAFDECVERRPLRTLQRLSNALREIVFAAGQIVRAGQELDEVARCLARAPELADEDTLLVVELATERFNAALKWIQFVTKEAALRQLQGIAGLALGELEPEHPSDSRPRIAVTPRPAPVRAFLAARLPRATDRITPVLQRRRRARRPAALSVPPRTSQGRAPPLSSIASL